MSRPVTYLKLHQEVFVPGLGSLTATLPPANKHYKLEMRWEDTGVFIRSGSYSFVIPHPNVIVAVLGPEDLPADKPAPEVKAPAKKA